jgi:UDP-N-acetylglucosamine 1-carboxyvinyltransferase
VGQFVVEGGRQLAGTFRVNGAKNAALPLLAASLLALEPVELLNVPDRLSDVRLMLTILERLGALVSVDDGGRVTVDPSGPLTPVIPDDLMREMRASLFLAGPLLGRTGEVRLAQPGGCDIGQRPIDLHLKGLESLGVTFERTAGGHLNGEARALKGGRVYLDYPSVGATENILMAAAAAEGETLIVNAAQEPEVVDLAQFLMRLGVRIGGAGTNTVHIQGLGRLGRSSVSHPIIPDRIEAGTVAIAAAITGGAVELAGVVPEHLVPLWQKLREMGVTVDYAPGGDTVRVEAAEKLRAVSLKTGPHPQFATDLQPQMVALLTQAEGVSLVRETVFENRLRHAGELNRMGARITVVSNTAWVEGPTALEGTDVVATDLRAGAALVLAGLAADGETRVHQADLIERGYQDWPARLGELGASVHAIP